FVHSYTIIYVHFYIDIYTRIEKSLLQAHFRSVNYCQYNSLEHRTLIYVSGSKKAEGFTFYLIIS
ncbi:hypothetical protein CD116_03610, partial [Staphylococcus schweitzeri]